ncbi:MAG: PilZ domain-containing protein [Anaerolineales bacterium]|nr:MAG: PilZ domain-containing protein [Anaerolineales bacterium]
MANERRKLSRKNFSYYMRVLNEVTGTLVGQLSDISTGGFKVESSQPIPLGTNFKLRIDHTGEISNKSHLTFTARARWCQVDPYDPTIYNVGFQLINMTPADYDIFVKMFNTYGMQRQPHHKSNTDYLWGK